MSTVAAEALHKEVAEASVRRFMTVLFLARAKRHLRTLAEHYGWSSAQLAEYEARFIHMGNMVPVFGSATYS